MKLIDKDALIAEIKRRLWLLVPKMTFHQQRVELEKLLSFLDTLEVKKVDLEEEIKLWFDYGLPNNEELLDYIKETAKHFFELGIKAKDK